MEDLENVKLNITTDKDTTVTILTGKAEPVIYPLKVAIKGSIDAPAEYFLKRKEIIDANNSRVEVNTHQKVITLIIGENKDNGITVTGKAEYDKDFLELGINSTKTYSLLELAKVLKFKGCYFKDREQHENLLTNLMNFKIRVEKDFENSNDFKGTAANSKATKIKHDIPLDFKLVMPVILGQPKIEIDVEVCIDASNGSVELWLESIKLKNEIDTIVAELLDKEVGRFDNELVVITVG